MQNKIVDMDGDGKTREIWKMIKDRHITPYLELETEYFDLGIQNRDETNDKITLEAAFALK